MTQNDDKIPRRLRDDAARLRELDTLAQDMRDVLKEMIALARTGADIKPADLIKKIADMHAAHLKVVQQEDVLHAKLGLKEEDALDYDAIRAEIGRKLDRIRASLDPDDISGGADGL